MARLTLANDPDYPARCSHRTDQRDTTPDLTWADQGLVTEWRCGPESMGSDHYSIWLELCTDGRTARLRQTKAVDWDAFRKVVVEYEERVPVTRRFSWAAQSGDATPIGGCDDYDPEQASHQTMGGARASPQNLSVQGQETQGPPSCAQQDRTGPSVR